jgi:hypothetical protein
MHLTPLLRSSISAFILGCTFSTFAQTTSVVREAANEFEGIKTIKVDAQFSKIDISPIEGNKVQFSGKLISDKQDEAYQLVNSAADGILTIAIKYPAQGWTTHSGEVVLKVPAGVALDIVTTSGAVKLDGLADANVKVVSKSGSLDCTKSKGNIYLESITGAIRATDCSGNVSTKSKSGNQFITRAEGNINANSTEGEITLAQTNGKVQTESTTGKQSIGFHVGDVNSKSVNGSIKISEVKGNIAVISFAGPLNLFKTTGLVNLQSTAGDQVGTRVLLTGSSSFKTTEGKIKMQIDNKTDELTFNLLSESAFIQARGTSKKKKLKLGKGTIVVTGESTTGGQVYN